MSRALSLVDIIEQLPDLPIGTRFETAAGSELYIATQTVRSTVSQRVLKWKLSGQLVGITEVTVGATYHLIPDYVEIGWQEAFGMIKEAIRKGSSLHTKVFIDTDDGFSEISAFDELEEDLGVEDFIDLFRIKFYKSNK